LQPLHLPAADMAQAGSAAVMMSNCDNRSSLR
jgi:hypothetical protein